MVLDKEERRPLFARKNTSDRILWKSWAVLKEALNIDPKQQVLFFKVLKSTGDCRDTALIGHELNLDQIPNRHLEYIATWYSLAAFSLLMSFIPK